MTIILGDPDQMFFANHPSRRFHIRPARGDEHDAEFMTLGQHDKTRRRIILWKVPGDVSMQFRTFAGKIMKTPFLVFADEEIRDDDQTVGAILDGVMKDAAKREGMTA